MVYTTNWEVKFRCRITLTLLAVVTPHANHLAATIVPKCSQVSPV